MIPAMTAHHAPHPKLFVLRFLSVEALSGLVLLLAAAIALAWANSPFAPAYQALWHLPLSLGLARFLPQHDLHFWVNDGLMTVFFLVVGLEIRREMHSGALANPKVALLPIVGAAGGVIVPALLYVALNTDPVTRHGWAIPTATDIAFAVGVLALVGRGIPSSLRMLLLTLAIIDDIAAILVIALVYSSGIQWAGFAVVAVGLALVFLLQWLSVRSIAAFILPAAIAWYGMLQTGMHPTLSGVILGLLTPVRAAYGRKAWQRGAGDPAPIERVEGLLHPWVAFGIMPLFALANAGVSLGGFDLAQGSTLTVGLGIVLGLVVGKPLGIALASYLAVRLKVCALPSDIRWRHIGLLGVLGGIGFTVAIFVANLAFADEHLLAVAKFAVLVASGATALLGWVLGRVLTSASRRLPHPPQRA
jgi:NhaA family Na+:H+ antiporter